MNNASIEEIENIISKADVGGALMVVIFAKFTRYAGFEISRLFFNWQGILIIDLLNTQHFVFSIANLNYRLCKKFILPLKN